MAGAAYLAGPPRAVEWPAAPLTAWVDQEHRFGIGESIQALDDLVVAVAQGVGRGNRHHVVTLRLLTHFDEVFELLLVAGRPV